MQINHNKYAGESPTDAMQESVLQEDVYDTSSLPRTESSPTRHTTSRSSSRLDSVIDNITRNRTRTTSRKNSASSATSASSRLPSVADPNYYSQAGVVRTRDSAQSFNRVSTHQDKPMQPDATHHEHMPPPRQETQHHRVRPSEDWDKHANRPAEQTSSNGTKPAKVIRKSVKDFNFARTLGEGSYSTVIAATDRQTLREYAIKVLDKRHIIKEKKVKYVNIERNTLFRLGDHPGIVRLYYTFQDDNSLYFVLDLATNGELLGVLKKLTTFDEECARYYSAQILDAIDYMHSKGVIHRDLKPENVLLDDKMRVKIADFGTAKLLDLSNGSSTQVDETEGLEDPERAKSFVGTAEYVSPELLTEKSTCKASDLWALGCILFQLLSGKPPFKASNEYQTFQKIVHLEYTFPPSFPPAAQDLISRLLVLDPRQRLSVPEIRTHEFFSNVDWRNLWKQKAPKLRPYRLVSTIHLNGSSEPKQLYSQPRSRNSSAVQLKPAPVPSRTTSAERIDHATPEESAPSELDLQHSSILSLPSERILRLGQIGVTSSSGDSIPRKFNKLLNRKKTRTLMITTHGRCLFLEQSKIKAEMLLTGPTTTNIKRLDAPKSWIVETPSKSYLFEDSNATASDWVSAIAQANEIILRLRSPYGGSSDSVDGKRRSKSGLNI